MRDASHLKGSAVRAHGRQGRLVAVAGPWVKVGWEVDGEILPREESYLRSDPFIDEEVEVLSMQGWVALGTLIGAENEMRPRVRDYDSIMNDLAVLDAGETPAVTESVELTESPGSKLRSPFKRAAKTFMGPRSGWFHKFPGRNKGKHMARHHKKDVWDCHGEGPYKQVCVAVKAVPEQGIKKGAIKNVTQPSGTKSKYNKEYKAFNAASQAKASRSRLLKQMKKKEKLKAAAKAAKK